jgi:hypothetical protein
MTIVRVRGFQIFRDRHGKWRCYHRTSRTPVDLNNAPLGSAEFFSACAQIVSLREAKAPRRGTLGVLITDYRAHSAFTDLAPRTRSDYQKVFDYLKPIADTPLVRFNRPLVVGIRDKAAKRKGRKFGNDVKARLSGLFAWVLSAATSLRMWRAASRISAAKKVRPRPIGHGATRSARR